MKIDDMEVGMVVQDSWYPDWGFGTVTKVLKTVVYIDFTVRGKEKYDKEHVRWLERTDKDFFKESKNENQKSEIKF